MNSLEIPDSVIIAESKVIIAFYMGAPVTELRHPGQNCPILSVFCFATRGSANKMQLLPLAASADYRYSSLTLLILEINILGIRRGK